MFEEEQKAMPLQEYWRVVCARRWWILLTIFVSWAIASAASWAIPAVYRSETLILLEQQKVPEQYVATNVAVDLQERLQSMTQQIMSRTRLQRIIEQFGLYPKDRGRLSADELVDRMRNDIKIDLVQSKDKKEELTAFRIHYSAPSARTAQQVTSQLASLFIDENLQAQQQLSESTTAFLANEMEKARNELAAQEAKVREFKAQYLGQLPSQLESNVQFLSGLQSQQQALTQTLNRSQQQKLYLESLMAQYESFGDSEEALPTIDREIARLKTELAASQARYTPDHPDIARLKGQLERTERLRDQIGAAAPAENKRAARKSALARGSGNVAPAIQVESQLKANAREIEDTQADLRRVGGMIAQYQQRLNLTPMREQQLATLTRDYERSKENYDSLIKKQMQSQLATNLEKRQQGQQFRLLDPPSVPTKPFSPNRMLFSLAGLAVGMVLALGLIAGMEILSKRIWSERDLEGLANARVLVGVPHLDVLGERRRRISRLVLEWSSATVMLVIVVVGNLFTFYKG